MCGVSKCQPRRQTLMKLTAALAATLSLAAAPPQRSDGAIIIPGGHLHLVQRGERTVITVQTGGAARRLVLPKEDDIHAGAKPQTILVGALSGQVLILRSDYASNPSGGAFQCGAGVEAVLRVLVLHPALRQTFSQRIVSCWDDIEEGDLAWDPRTHTLTVERTTVDHSQSAAPAQDLRTHYHADPNGTVRAGLIDHLPV